MGEDLLEREHLGAVHQSGQGQDLLVDVDDNRRKSDLLQLDGAELEGGHDVVVADEKRIYQFIFSMMKGIKGIRLTSVRKVLEENNVEYSDIDIKKVLKEYCVTKGGMYHVKGTLMASS